MKCYEIVNCPFNGRDPKKAKCQVYQEQSTCWEYNWAALYRGMPDGAEKEAWQLAMHEYCPQCRAYQKHQVEKDRQLERIK